MSSKKPGRKTRNRPNTSSQNKHDEKNDQNEINDSFHFNGINKVKISTISENESVDFNKLEEIGENLGLLEDEDKDEINVNLTITANIEISQNKKEYKTNINRPLIGKKRLS